MSTQVSERKPQPMSNRQLMRNEQFVRELQVALPKTFDAGRLARVALTAMTRTPLLEQCDQASLARCLLDLASVGLEPDGRHAHLIPFKNAKRQVVECQLIIDYKGYVQLLFRSGLVQSIHADVVYEGDDFVYDRGVVAKHTKWEWRGPSRPEMRGEMIGAYASVRLHGGAESHVAMSRDEIEAIRKRSKSGNSGPWVTDFNEMSKKTVFKRLVKWLPISAEVRTALEKDSDIEDEQPSSRSKSAIVLSDIMREAEPIREDVVEGSVVDDSSEPDWAEDFAKVQDQLEAAQGQGDVFAIEEAWLNKHADKQWRSQVSAAIVQRLEAIEG